MPFLFSKRFGWKKGLEPSTSGTTIQRSNRLSYIHHFDPRSRNSANRCANVICFFGLCKDFARKLSCAEGAGPEKRKPLFLPYAHGTQEGRAGFISAGSAFKTRTFPTFGSALDTPSRQNQTAFASALDFHYLCSQRTNSR